MNIGVDKGKRAAAAAALEHVKDGMRVGLGTGSTAAYFVDLLGERVRAGLGIEVVPTSEETARQATERGMRLIELDGSGLDLAVDGADEVGPDFSLVKGGGGALLREKIVAESARCFIVIADISKRVDMLGSFPLPVEVVSFGLGCIRERVLGAANGCGIAPGGCELRRAGGSGEPVCTDSGHFLLDLQCGVIPEARELARSLSLIPGVVEHGLFVGVADMVILGGEDGVEVLRQ